MLTSLAIWPNRLRWNKFKVILGTVPEFFITNEIVITTRGCSINCLDSSVEERQKLEVTDGFDAPPIFFHLISGQKFSDYAEMSQRLLIFTNQELMDLESLYEIISELN